MLEDRAQRRQNMARHDEEQQSSSGTSLEEHVARGSTDVVERGIMQGLHRERSSKWGWDLQIIKFGNANIAVSCTHQRMPLREYIGR
jgi:hypothetical protein